MIKDSKLSNRSKKSGFDGNFRIIDVINNRDKA